MTTKRSSLLRTTTKRSSLFWGKYRMTPLVTVPGDTNVSDATGPGECPRMSRHHSLTGRTGAVRPCSGVCFYYFYVHRGTEHERHLVQHYRSCFYTRRNSSSNNSGSNSSWAHKLAKIRISRSSSSHFIASLHAYVVFCMPLQTARNCAHALLVISSRHY